MIRQNMDYRNLVVGVNEGLILGNGKIQPLINFDNAATTPPLKRVMKRINEFVPLYSSIHRGTGFKSRYSSRLYEEARENVADFVKADQGRDTVIFVKNTTEGINKLAYRLSEKKDGRDIILSTSMEHHSNDLPWRKKFKVYYIELDEKGRLSLDDLKNKINKFGKRIKLIAVTGCSNVTGYINPIYEVAKLAHSVGAKILVDGAQLVPHCPFDMKPHYSPEHIDYLVFSAHKMYAPFGIGVLIGPRQTFEEGAPELSGGGTVDVVTHSFVKWAEPPHRDEAGTPNVIGVVALSEAIDTLNSIGLENIRRHEARLTKYAMEGLKIIKGLHIYGDSEDYNDRVGIITFNLEGMDHQTLANALSYEAGIAVRNGCFCAHPYLYKLLKLDETVSKIYMNNPKLLRPGMVRISFGFYNTFWEIDILIKTLKEIVKNKDYYIKAYSNIKSII